MKKLALIFLALIMVFSMAACGGNDSGSGSGTVISVEIDIDYPDASGIADVEDFVMEVPEGTNALEMLEMYCDENDIEMLMATGSPTEYVTSINGVAESADAGWVYEVNDEMTMEAADKCVLTEGMGITWEYMSWAEMGD
ncbi:MAG: DUF4430 domain-containing protein [Firmicutes bacterium]|nr:DUF4430 domain-containing protein [Bacillota bacterium]